MPTDTLPAPTTPTVVQLAVHRGDPCGCHAEYETRFPGITQSEDPHHPGCKNDYPRPPRRVPRRRYR